MYYYNHVCPIQYDPDRAFPSAAALGARSTARQRARAHTHTPHARQRTSVGEAHAHQGQPHRSALHADRARSQRAVQALLDQYALIFFL